MDLHDVEDLYQLSPLQAGMLLHELRSPHQEIYGVQVRCQLTGNLDSGLFRQAWEEVIASHTSLRAAFLSDRLEQPVQVILRTVTVPWHTADLRDLATAEQQERLGQLTADGQRRFRLDRAPLLRLSLARLADEEHELVWSFHHLLLDGWSMLLVLREVLARYHSLSHGQSRMPSQTRPFRDYVGWLTQQDTTAAKRFWRRELSGVKRSTPLGIDWLGGARPGTPGTAGFGEHHCTLSPAVTSKLRAYAREHRLTMNSVTQGAWALLLSQYSGESDVVFGALRARRLERGMARSPSG
jgi:Condensation domain